MSHPDAYKSIDSRHTGVFKDRGSKFLGYLFPCKNEDELKELINELKKEHSGARHFCYGAIIGSKVPQELSNDDGEPGGTAGLPILNQLLSKDLKNALIVVVRYFGGTKLGKPGLIQAYKEGAMAALKDARVITYYHRTQVVFKFHYDATGAVMQSIEKIEHAKIVDQKYAQDCRVYVLIPDSLVEGTLPLFDHTNDVEVYISDA